MKKTLEIGQLVVMTKLGLHEFEKKHVQAVLMDLEIDCKKDQKSLDKLQDYSFIGHLIQTHVNAYDYDLVEALADDVWALLERNNVNVRVLKVTKLNPPCYESRVKIDKVTCVISR